MENPRKEFALDSFTELEKANFCVQRKRESRQASQQHIQAHMSLCAMPIVCWYFFRELWLHLKYDPFHHCTTVATEFEFGSLFKSSGMGSGVHI